MKNKFFYYQIITIGILLFSTSCKFEQPEFKGFSDVKIQPASSKEVVLLGEAQFFNPNKFDMLVKELEIAVDIDGKHIGTIRQELEREVAGQSDFSLPLKLSFPSDKLYDNVISGLLNIATGKKFEVHYEGQVKAKAFGFNRTIPVNSTQSIKVKL